MNFDKLRFTNEEAAGVSRETIAFSFGANWKKYIESLSEANIRCAQNSFTEFTRLPNLTDVTYLDLGCGSGLNSLVAQRLGAKRIVSVDTDPNCIDCVSTLRMRYGGSAANWEILKGSIL